MKSGSGWASAQMPTFVTSNPVQKPTFVDPAVKADEAAALRTDIEAFLRNGGRIEQVTTLRPAERNGRGA
jgi:hypothetical protein